MQLLKDVRIAARLVTRLYASRRDRNRIARIGPEHPWPDPGTIRIAVYFADTDVNLYQLRQWYAPLAEIAMTWPVAIISREPSAVLELWQESPVPAVFLRKVAELERFVADQQLQIVFYVNQNPRNFQMFRYGRMWHVFINHGESDKMYMTSNQVKAYDYSFVAGQAAVDRLRSRLWDFDIRKRVITIGRPQTDHLAGRAPFESDERTVVLYAPTWEGDRAAAAYGSIASHGVALTSAILGSGQHRLVYRPHPRSGVVSPEYGSANRTIIDSIARANAADPGAGHVYDTTPLLDWQLALSDVAITDISAMVYDRLATGKPLLIARPVSPDARIDSTGYLGACEWLLESEASDIVSIIERVRFDEGAQERLRHWVERHFGDTAPGVATMRLHAAIEKLMADWDRHAKVHARDQRGEPDPLGDDDEDDE